jgi:hypothetical protein
MVVKSKKVQKRHPDGVPAAPKILRAVDAPDFGLHQDTQRDTEIWRE